MARHLNGDMNDRPGSLQKFHIELAWCRLLFGLFLFALSAGTVVVLDDYSLHIFCAA